MMRLTYPLLGEPLEFKENIINVLVLESPKCFRQFMEQLKFQTMKYESNVYLSKNFEDVVFNKYVDVIFHAFDIDVNNKKIINRIYSDLSEISNLEDLYIDTLEVNATVSKYLNKLTQKSQCLLTYDEINVEMLLKSANVKIDNEGQGLLENICNYIDLVSEYFKINIFIFFHLKEYLEKEELISLYEHCNYMKQSLLLCENIDRMPLKYEKVIIIDKDLCEIY